MRMHLDFTPIQKELEKLERQSVTVGVLDPDKRAAKPDMSKGLTRMSSADAQQGLGGSSIPRRYIKRGGNKKAPTLRRLAFWLDKDRGIFSSVLMNPKNEQLIKLAQEFAIVNKTPQDEARLEKIARALVRNPILRGDYGSNSPDTKKRKGFDHFGIQTGTLFNNIKAKYQRW
ncbi:TPA: hypothetical protein P0E12_004987 [Vibrio harveyi]|nr:hypothetical protein [Vibrio harveyi]